MYLRYHPEGSEEPTIFNYNPKKMMSAERELIEKKTNFTFEQFHTKLLEGSSICRRVLLFVMLKRTAPGIRFEDVDFAWGECELGLYKHEIEEMQEQVEKSSAPDGQREEALRQLREMLADAVEDPDSGKAPSKS